jgi:hypothetical protein
MPGGMPLVHSLVLSEFELLVAKDVVETASRRGEAIGGLSLDDGIAGLMSGDWVGGGEGLEERALPFPLENLAACFVTAATTPPLSLPFFLSFLETGIEWQPGRWEEQLPAHASTELAPLDLRLVVLTMKKCPANVRDARYT